MDPEYEIRASSQGFGPGGYTLDLEARIWASRLGFEPRDWDLGLITGIYALSFIYLGVEAAI